MHPFRDLWSFTIEKRALEIPRHSQTKIVFSYETFLNPLERELSQKYPDQIPEWLVFPNLGSIPSLKLVCAGDQCGNHGLRQDTLLGHERTTTCLRWWYCRRVTFLLPNKNKFTSGSLEHTLKYFHKISWLQCYIWLHGNQPTHAPTWFHSSTTAGLCVNLASLQLSVGQPCTVFVCSRR